jgi:hypothetical protein
MVSYVDPITNTAVFSQVDLRQHLVSFIKLDFPERLLPTFLHESTHHACFLSPVGATLALLRLRAYRRSEVLRTDSNDDEWELLEDVLRQEGTMEVLRPLSEGLACFAELDSIPGDSNALTTPMASSFFLFGGVDHELKSAEVLKKHGPGFFLFSLLYRARTDDELFRRREAVLNAKFGSSSGGHLAGYMTVKALWARAKRTSDLAWDPELFSMFVRSYFYDDFGLVAKILDSSKKEHNAVNAIAQYILERASRLFDLEWDTALWKHLEDDSDDRYRRHGFGLVAYTSPGGINVDDELKRLGMVRLDGLLSELDDWRCLDDERQRSMRHRDLVRMQKRELLCLGSLDLHVVVNDHGRVLIYPLDGAGRQEYPIYAVQALEGINAGEGPGSVEIYLIPSENARASAIVRGGQIVHVHFEGPISAGRQKHFTGLFGSRSEELRAIDEQEKALNSSIGERVINFVRAQALTTIPAGVDQLYSVTSTFNFPAEKRESAMSMLIEGGLRSLCDNDEEFIQALAMAGCAGSVITRRSELEKIAVENGIDLNAMLGTASALEERMGFRTMMATDELFITEL